MFLRPFEINLQNPFRSSDEDYLPGDIHSQEHESKVSTDEDLCDRIKNVGKGIDDKMQELDRSIRDAEATLKNTKSALDNEIAIQKQLLQNIESMQHKIWKTKDMFVKKKEIHSKLNKDIDNLVHQSVDLETKCKLKEMECAKLERDNQLYIDRMNSKASELEKCFCESQEVKDLKKAEEKLAQLLEKRDSMKQSLVTSYNSSEAGGTTTSVDNYHHLGEDELAFLISEEEIKQASLIQSIEELKKKNAARKTRLIKQHRVEMSRHKQWAEKAKFLQTRI